MKKKLIIYNVVVALVVLLLTLLTGVLVTSSNYSSITETKLKQITEIYVSNYSDDLVIPQDGEVRVTVIAADGTVLKDNFAEIGEEENHLDRDEIVAARNGTPTVVERYSSTLNKSMLYYAEMVDVGDTFVYVRVAVPSESVNSFVLKSIVPMIFILLAVWLCAVVASVLLSGLLLKPLRQVKEGLNRIAEGTYRKVVPATGDGELDGILSGINDVSEKLQANMQEAESGKQRLNYVLANVSDGIVAFDGSLTIVIANDSLKGIFGVTEPEGKRVEALTADRAFISAIEDCARKKEDVLFQLETEGRYFLCTARYTESDFIIVVLSDVTKDKQSEKVRLEFFANASHELKTPLTAIKGFNDMISMQSGEEAVLAYSGRIEKEIDRIISLLNDMLDLSKLENSRPEREALVCVDLAEVAGEVKEELRPLSEEKQITVSVEGGGCVTAEREHMYQLIKNLAENGVRYNNPGGHVNIRISALGGKTELVVSDDGIGIEASQQTRIFERFYRVNKSRSRATGGTGLGLAIVKHVCELYGAELTLKSKLSAGTTISVTFKA